MALSYDNVVDADGHILEPLDLWERYIDPPLRERALRMTVHGDREVIEIGGKPSRFLTPSGLNILGGGMGKSGEELGALSSLD